MNEAEIWLRAWSYKPDSNVWKYATVYNLSRDFIREYKDIIIWNKVQKRQLKEVHGQKFYEEVFGKEECLKLKKK